MYTYISWIGTCSWVFENGYNYIKMLHLHVYPFSFLFDNDVSINTNSPRQNSVFTTMGACFWSFQKKQHINALYKWSRISSTPDLYKKNEWPDDENSYTCTTNITEYYVCLMIYCIHFVYKSVHAYDNYTDHFHGKSLCIFYIIHNEKKPNSEF